MILIITSGRPTSVPNFSWIGERVCELQQFFKCEKMKKGKKEEKKLESLLTHISETLNVIFFKFGV